MPALKRELTLKHFDKETGTTTPVYLFDDWRHEGYIGLPRRFGKTRFNDIWRAADDRRVRPNVFKGLFKPLIGPRDDQQAEFVKNLKALYDNVTREAEGDVQVCAATGSGKTVSFVVSAALAEVAPILVIVHTNRLKNGWLGSVEQKKGLRFIFGNEWVDKYVGICQQDRCDFKGKKIVIALAPSLCSRVYPEEFYEYFGIVGIDEVHKMATPVFNNVLGLFPAFYHIGLTATPKEGPLKKCITAHIGEPMITSAQEVMQPKVFRVKWQPDFPVNVIDYTTGEIGDDSKNLITPLTRNKKRQELLTDLIFWRGYRRGRQCLVLSDRTDQLSDFKRRLIDLGVPENEIGMYAGSYKTGQFKLTGSVSRGNVTKHFRGLPPFSSRDAAMGYVNETLSEMERGPVIKKIKIAPWRHKPKENEYEDIEKHCSIVLATYGIFDVGIDVARLNWGLEASPRGDVAQAVGRILRILAGKAIPEWYSIFDVIYTMVRQEFIGQIVEQKRYYAAPARLEKRRRLSYRKQNAIEMRIDDAAQAIQRAKDAARPGRNSTGQIRRDEGSTRAEVRPLPRLRKLRLVKRTA